MHFIYASSISLSGDFREMASIQGIYVALFGRPADPAGLAFYNQVTDNGADLSKIGDLTSSAEYLSRLEGKSASGIVETIFENLFNREADEAGLNYWADRLESKSVSINDVAIAILDGAQGDDSKTVDAKI